MAASVVGKKVEVGVSPPLGYAEAVGDALDAEDYYSGYEPAFEFEFGYTDVEPLAALVAGLASGLLQPAAEPWLGLR